MFPTSQRPTQQCGDGLKQSGRVALRVITHLTVPAIILIARDKLLIAFTVQVFQASSIGKWPDIQLKVACE